MTRDAITFVSEYNKEIYGKKLSKVGEIEMEQKDLKQGRVVEEKCGLNEAIYYTRFVKHN